MHWRLIADGAVVLVVAFVLERHLRHRNAGITSQALGDEPAGLELMQLAGAAHLGQVPAAPEGFQGQGGSFGGGGASGRF
jgi:uncharacterized membrane protein YgcG